MKRMVIEVARPGRDSVTSEEYLALTSAVANARGGVFNPLDYGAVGDGVADDRAAVQAALDAIHAAGGGTLRFGAGRYRIGFRAGFYVSSAKIGCFIYGDNVTIECAPGAEIYVDDGHANGFFLFTNVGSAITPANVDGSGSWWNDHAYPWPSLSSLHHPIYTINPASKGSKSITLATPADTSHFSVGDAVFIRTGQTIDSSGEAQPDAELNEITAVNAGTGVLSLKRPLAKPYAQEYFATSGRNTATTTTSSAYPAYLGVQNVETWISRNLAFRNLSVTVEQSAGHGYVLGMGSVFGYEISGLQANLHNASPQVGGPYRDARFTNNTAALKNDIQADVFLSSDRGCGDWLWADSTFVSTGTYPAFLHVHEATYNSQISRMTLVNLPSATNTHAIQVMGRGYGVMIGDNTIVHESSGTGAPIYVGDNVADATVVNNKVAGNPSVVAAQRSIVRGHDGLLATSRSIDGDVHTMSRWVYYNSDASVILGKIPQGAWVLSCDVQVVQAFNGTSPQLTIGNLGGYYGWLSGAAGIALGSAGIPAITRSPDTGYYQQSGATERAIEIGYTGGGSSVGKALVMVTWCYAEKGIGV